MLEAQRGGGNRALAKALQTRGEIQRFTEVGHKAIGDAAFGHDTMKLGDVEMSYGDAVAMGDYFGSFDQMRRLAEKPGKGMGHAGEVKYVLWVHIWGRKPEAKMSQWYDESAAQIAETRSRGLDSVNISHFPNPDAGDTGLAPQQKTQRHKDGVAWGAAATYREGHQLAIELAHQNGAKQERNNDEALLADGYACHFLTDSFSGSHLRTARGSIKEYWDARVPHFHMKMINWLADEIDKEHWGAANRGLAVPIKGGSVRALAQEQLIKALAGANYSFGNLVSLIIHDAEGASGVEATVDGSQITLAGDKNLVDDKGAPTSSGQPTFDAATRAVKASVEDIYTAFEAGMMGKDWAAVEKSLQRDGLYAAERLTPTAVPDAQLPAEKRSLPWMQKTVDEFLAENEAAIGIWGPSMASEFEGKLDSMKDLRAEAKHGMQRALIAPMRTGGKEVGKVIKAIASHS